MSTSGRISSVTAMATTASVNRIRRSGLLVSLTAVTLVRSGVGQRDHRPSDPVLAGRGLQVGLDQGLDPLAERVQVGRVHIQRRLAVAELLEPAAEVAALDQPIEVGG